MKEFNCQMPPDEWAYFNSAQIFTSPQLAEFAAPFPPTHLMESVSGLTRECDFAAHGAHFWQVLNRLSPSPLSQYGFVLDFGCGVGRLARMFKGHPGKIHGCDIDKRHIDWVRESLPWINTKLTSPDEVLPYVSSFFDLIISISIFTHLTETSQNFLLSELHRIAKKDGVLMLTIHGERALERAINETEIYDMLCIDSNSFDKARKKFISGQHAFILQNGHLTTDAYQYGITFLSKEYIDRNWGKWFHVEKRAAGAIHDFQDVLVLRPR